MAIGRIPEPGTGIPESIVDAKGDIVTATAADTPARLAVGADGTTLVADSATATGLAYREDYAAGKNKIINGDFNINQRAFTSTTTDSTYGFDRWILGLSGGTGTYSAETFTPGAAPVAGYESKNFARLVTTVGNDRCSIRQKIEDVRTFAGQTVTLSFYAKGTNPTSLGGLIPFGFQDFGSGGSGAVTFEASSMIVLTANWTRYSVTLTVPSVSGKTIGTSSYLAIAIGQGASVSTDSWTLDIWGVQLEAGSVATAFNTATGTIQGELAACQRYYYRISDPAGTNLYTAITVLHDLSAQNATTIYGITANPVPMRAVPTSTEFSQIAFHRSDGTIFPISAVTIDSATDSTYGSMYSLTVSGATGGNVGRVIGNNNSGTYFGVSAEL
jgi:hypothetical protein